MEILKAIKALVSATTHHHDFLAAVAIAFTIPNKSMVQRGGAANFCFFY